ncbi:methyl-accepting chemotaxis protein [Pseudoalteromonas xiamenensis]|uniref:methyl-accepting chemotaxis protein n=1 Tax=Pseudoalteromonas xiamenensis TaxID=882626 RepID=UPI0027E4A78F|nr:methyl-accepting chemotaxis protein [Pseudoalteromonas xiamenensis]WMN59705.1 methyl-accepting chemotaxis protein [Pseudoalteromonas xiamenensis]
MLITRFTITQKITLLGSLIALSVSILIGATALYRSENMIAQRMMQSELPSKVENINRALGEQINELKNAAEQLSSNELILAAARNNTLDESVLISELTRLTKQYDLVTASWANRKTAQYWNQKGFLRVLNQNQDGWFFGFTQSSEPFSISIYQESPGDVKMFVNHQQTNGIGLAGLAKSIDDMQAMLSKMTIEKTGFVFVVDSRGQVQLHRDASKVAKATLSDFYGASASRLLNGQTFTVEEIKLNGEQTIVASSPIKGTALYVIAQVPSKEVFAGITTLQWQIVSFSIVIAVIASLLSFFLARTLSAPLSTMANTFSRLGSGEAKLNYRVPESPQPELQALATGFNQFISKIEQAIAQVACESSDIRQASEEVFKQSKRNSQQLDEQKSQTISVAAAINEMGATVQEIAGSANNTAKLTEDSKLKSNQTHEHVLSSQKTLLVLATDIEAMAEQVGMLATKTQAIANIVDVIRGISEQTNLLALNAAIESARAGEHGRGFAVVADEVRALASRTSKSTDEIQSMISELTLASDSIVARIEQGKRQADNSVSTMQTSVELIKIISDTADQINDMTTLIAAATEEQSNVVADVGRTIEQISGISDDVMSDQLATEKSIQALADSARALDTLVATFER